MTAIASVNMVSALSRAITKLSEDGQLKSHKEDVLSPTIDKLLGVTIHSHEILYKAKTVFPFNFFPDTIIIDKEKLTIIARYFFWVAKITSVPIRDILSVEADVGPFFGSIHLTSRYFFTNPHSINFLWRKDVFKIQKLVQGFIIANEREIDCSAIDKSQLEELLEHLGETNEKVGERLGPHVRQLVSQSNQREDPGKA
jgi:hypothetical protein